MQWEVAVDTPDVLGESPFWHPREERLYWVDISAKRVRRLHPASGALDAWDLPQEPGCIAPAASGGLVLALRDGIYRARNWGAPLEPLARFEHAAHSRFNDGRADALGRFWAGTIYEPKDARKAQLYCLDARQGEPSVQRMAGNATTANGLAFSPQNDRLYWTDTPSHAISVWDWDAEANALRNQRVFHQFPPKPAGWTPGDAGYGGRPDGAAVDAEGHYWCAMYEGGRLLRLAPDGSIAGEFELPVLTPTMPCFGGPDGRTLYLTSARGCVLRARVDVAGLPTNFFID
jgi:sugar lactone lactonase YvrE